ncbi:MAG: hypothetical protein ACKOQS_18885, partial [Dolichospermum sp.]
ANISGKRYARTSIVAGLHNNAIIAAMVFKGYCDTQGDHLGGEGVVACNPQRFRHYLGQCELS